MLTPYPKNLLVSPRCARVLCCKYRNCNCEQQVPAFLSSPPEKSLRKLLTARYSGRKMQDVTTPSLTCLPTRKMPSKLALASFLIRQRATPSQSYFLFFPTSVTPHIFARRCAQLYLHLNDLMTSNNLKFVQAINT